MEIKQSIRYFSSLVLKHLFISFLISIFFYVIIVLPNVNQIEQSDKLILFSVTFAFPFAYLIAATYPILHSYLAIKKQKISISNHVLTVITGAISLDTQSIPLSQINHVDTNSSLIDTFFGISTLIIGSDTDEIVFPGVDKKEAIHFAEKVASQQKIRVTS